MKIRFLVLSFFSVLLVGLARGQSNSDTLKKRFLSEYPEALKAWESRYASSEGTYRYTGDDPTNKAAPHREFVGTFKCKLPDMGILTSIRNTDERSEQRVDGYNKKYSFSLKKVGDGGDFSVQSLQAVNGAELPPRSSPIRRTLRPILWVPYGIPFSTDRMVSNPRFVVQAVSPVSRNGKNMLKVEFDWPYDPNRTVPKKARDPGGYEGFFLVSPQEKWVLYEYECREKEGASRIVYKGTVDYQGSLDGFPIPRRATCQRLKLPGGELVETYSYDFLKFRFVDLPDQDFSLAAFGIPEQVTRPSKVARKGILGYWFLALALAALAAAVFFKMASSRLKRATRT